MITVDLDRRCTRCGKKGATNIGVCLTCTAKHMKEKRMTRRRKSEPPRDDEGFYDPANEAGQVADTVGLTDPEQAQPPLIPMSDDELRTAGKKLAKLVKDLVEMKAEHKEIREEQSADRKKLEAQIEATAGTIRSQGR